MNKLVLSKHLDLLKNNIQESLESPMHRETTHRETTHRETTHRETIHRETKEHSREIELSELTNTITSLKDIVSLQKSRQKQDREYKRACRINENVAQHDASLKTHYNPEEYPPFLFVHRSLVKSYGTCPCLNGTPDQRYKWLMKTHDHGKMYFELMNRIVRNKDLDKLNIDLQEIENEINKLLDVYLPERCKELLAVLYIKIPEYTSIKTKNKKTRDLFKTIIGDILQIESSICISEFLALKFSLSFPVPVHADTRNINEIIFKDLVKKYGDILQEIKTESGYIQEVSRNLHLELQEYIVKQNVSANKQAYVQVGKYFKKWNDLTPSERECRLESFAKFYTKSQDTSELMKILRPLEYKYLRWDITAGVIKGVKGLKYIDEKYTITDPVVNKTVRNCKSRDIFTVVNEKIINEIVLQSIITNVPKDTVLEQIKSKLNIKKITNADKIRILETYDKISGLILEHS